MCEPVNGLEFNVIFTKEVILLEYLEYYVCEALISHCDSISEDIEGNIVKLVHCGVQLLFANFTLLAESQELVVFFVNRALWLPSAVNILL